MFTNSSMFFNDVYRCKRKVMEYLNFKKGLLFIGLDGDYYIFMDTPELRDALNKMPILLKVSALLDK